MAEQAQGWQPRTVGAEEGLTWILDRYDVDLTEYVQDDPETYADPTAGALVMAKKAAAEAVLEVAKHVLRGTNHVWRQALARQTWLDAIAHAARDGDLTTVRAAGEQTFDVMPFMRLATLVAEVNAFTAAADVMIQVFMPVRQQGGA